jgi:S-formylglutathione hydrolase FrmB
MLIHNNFRSWCLNSNTDVDIIIPDPPQNADLKDFYRGGKKYKVLWLLHGTYGGYNDFVRRTNIDMYAKECGLIVVMPNAMNSDYMNWPDFNLGFRMYDFLLEELMPMVYGWLPASDRKEDNFIGGISMGAWGAYKYAVNHPELFAGCSCMSATPADVESMYRLGKADNRTLNQIKNAGGIEAYLKSCDNLWDITKNMVGNPDAPTFYFSIGKDDFLYERYVKFKDYCGELGWKEPIFDEQEGYGHEWRLWELEIQKSLEVFGLHGVRNVTKASDFKQLDGSHL